MDNELDTIRIKQLELVDSKGQVKAVFGIGKDDQPSLQIMRQNGSIAFKLSNHVYPGVDLNREKHERGECTILEFFDMEGVTRIRIQMNDEIPQYPGIALLDSKGKERVELVVTPNDDAEIHVLDAGGHTVWMEES